MRNGPTLVAKARQLGPAFDLLANYRAGGFFLERSGLGLRIVRTLVREDLRGQFELVNGQGVRALVSFPRFQTVAHAEPAPPAAAGAK